MNMPVTKERGLRRCDVIGCTAEHARHLLMCGCHWKMVPPDVQRAVYRHLRAGETSKWLRVRLEAISHVALSEHKFPEVEAILDEFYETKEEKVAFLASRQKLLSDRSPIVLMAHDEGAKLVLQVLQQLADGAYL